MDLSNNLYGITAVINTVFFKTQQSVSCKFKTKHATYTNH